MFNPWAPSTGFTPPHCCSVIFALGMINPRHKLRISQDQMHALHKYVGVVNRNLDLSLVVVNQEVWSNWRVKITKFHLFIYKWVLWHSLLGLKDTLKITSRYQRLDSFHWLISNRVGKCVRRRGISHLLAKSTIIAQSPFSANNDEMGVSKKKISI